MPEKTHYDLIIVGAGPGGYVAAIKAAQQNGKIRKIALVEKSEVGGVCLNAGCIPTKTLLTHAHVLHTVQNAADFGITTGDVHFDYEKIKTRKDNVIKTIRKNLENLILANRIEILKGNAEFVGFKEIKVKGTYNGIISADNIIIATGSVPSESLDFPCDHRYIFNSSSILELKDLPKTLAIVGGGYIGCEFASLFTHFGVKVTLLEALPVLIISQGKSLSTALTASLKNQGVEVETGTTIQAIDICHEKVHLRLTGKSSNLVVEKVLMAIGRKTVSSDLHLEQTGVLVNEKGSISVNDKMETNVPGIYAIGDITGKTMLAHVASHQAIVAALNIAGIESKMDYTVIPSVIFTLPEIATVGLTLEQALEKGYSAKEGKFPFQALGKAIASKETEGFAQIVIDEITGQILGAQIFGSSASCLIEEMALAIKNELTIECIIETIHPHPTLSEIWLEAAFLAINQPLHYPPRKNL